MTLVTARITLNAGKGTDIHSIRTTAAIVLKSCIVGMCNDIATISFAECAVLRDERGRLPGHDMGGQEGEGVEQVGQLRQDGVGNLDVEGLLYEASPGVPEWPCSQLKGPIEGPRSQLKGPIEWPCSQLKGPIEGPWLHKR